MLKRSKIVLYTTLIMGAIAGMPRLSVTFSTTNEQNRLLSARLKDLNYTLIPKSIASWRNLFLDLGYKYMMLDKKYGALDKNYEIILEKYQKLENETNKENSVLTVRSNIEDFEEHIDDELIFMRNKNMLKTLKDQDTKFLIKLTTSDRTEIVNQLGCEGYENVHFVKWLYFLLMSKSKLACNLRELLKNNTISEFHFCKAIGRIYEKVSNRIHETSIRITPALVREGLIMYGFTDESLLRCADVLPLLTGLTALYKGELSTLIPPPSPRKGK